MALTAKTASGFYCLFEPSYFRKSATDLHKIFRIGSLISGEWTLTPLVPLIHFSDICVRWDTTRSASVALAAGEPITSAISNNQQAARGIAGWATVRLCLTSSCSSL